MLKKSKATIRQAYWCVVSGNELWLADGEVPFGSAEQFSLPAEQAIQVGEFEGHPVMWLNDADLDGERELTCCANCFTCQKLCFINSRKRFNMAT
ncbi:NADH pyrophosphatase [Vibrio maritimus]|uniref:NADH pyrophosphatase n=1 Tax=Vibrio maritimus TaxID=990268 RepID=A0A090U5L2_9VIBR|nr:NADH pyrophosphatase [Vibrio maritimus]